mmetsp:Transcript_7680/g.10597  ORF Transcript_7680/g.10597 Transcript_7680/m.10597 type:complete len:531 (+) Transcript_7680:75-1667(+)
MNTSIDSMKSTSSSLVQQLYELLCCIHQIGKDLPQLLIHLVTIVQPQLPQERIIPVLGKMFEDIPGFLHQHEQQPTNQQFLKLLVDPPSELITLRLLLNLRELQQLIQKMSYLQLLHLSNNILPPGPQSLQVEFMQKAQEIFQDWTQEVIQNHHHVLSETPLHMERQQLLQLEPQLPWELLHFIIELIKLPLEELLNFKEWMSKLPRKQLIILVQLLQMEPAALLELKQRMDSLSFASSLPPLPTNVNVNQVQEPPTESNGWLSTNTDHVPNSMVPRNSNLDVATISPTKVTPFSYPTDASLPGQYQLRIARQPPARTVYQRILKPFPAVMLVGGSTNMETTNTNLFVEATLLRSDSDVELPLCIEGNRIVRISNGVFATFKKLKILSTSQQQGTLFRLKFVLKRYVGNVFEQIQHAHVVSNPIEVFSHTLYLTEKQEVAPPPPTVHEILPPNGGSGTRVAILGSNFVNSPTLVVRFGEVEVQPSFHEQGTLLCNVPSLPKTAGLVPVRVSNDSANFCETKVFFNYQQRG